MTSPGPAVRTDVIDAYVFRVPTSDRPGAADLLQLRRARAPMLGDWHPVMGHIEPGERAPQTLARELSEEVGLDVRSEVVLGIWALEGVRPFYLPSVEAIVFSPRFAVQVEPGWSPVLNDEHDAARWVPIDRAAALFVWPGQVASIRELADHVLPPSALSRERLRLNPSHLDRT